MKKIFSLLAACFCSVMVFAQAGSLLVQNQTNCPVSFVIQGGGIPTCRTDIFSNIITLAPNSAVSYTSSTMVPGFPATAIFMSMAYALDKLPGCPPMGGNGHRVGEPCSGNAASRFYATYLPTGNCDLCNANVLLQWIAAPSLGGQAILRFQ